MNAHLDVRQAIEAAACLCGERDERLTTSDKDDKARLRKRLDKRINDFHRTSSTTRQNSGFSLEEETGSCAVDALLALHHAVLEEETSQASQSASTSIPVLGVKDLRTLQTLLSIVCNWQLAALVTLYDSSLASLSPPEQADSGSAKLQEIPDEATLLDQREEKIEHFASCSRSTGAVLFKMEEVIGLAERRSTVSNVVLHTCLPQIMALLVRQSYGPLARRGDEEAVKGKQRASSFLSQLLRSISTSSCLRILCATAQVGRAGQQGRVMPSAPPFVKGAVERLYSAQLLRTDGVMALLGTVFSSNEDLEGNLMKKLVSVGQLLSTPPPNMSTDAFASIIGPRLLQIISELPNGSEALQEQMPSRQSTPTQKTAASFALARLHDVAPAAMTIILQATIWRYLTPNEGPIAEGNVGACNLEAAVSLLLELVEHSEPSATFLSFLLRPIVIPLFTLYSFLQLGDRPLIVDEKGKGNTSMPSLPATLHALLVTFFRLSDVTEACQVVGVGRADGLFSTVRSSVTAVSKDNDNIGFPYWSIDEDGQVCLRRSSDRPADDLTNGFASLQVKDMEKLLHFEEGQEENMQSTILSALQLSPSPSMLASILKDSARKDIASQLLSDLLDAYSVSKENATSSSKTLEEGDSLEGLAYVQHIQQLISTFGPDVLSGQAARILLFINFCLGSEGKEPSRASQTPRKESQKGPLAELTNISHDLNEAPWDLEDSKPDEELAEVAAELLLSLLEGDKDLSKDTHPILGPITAKLEKLAARGDGEKLRALTREALLVLQARHSRKVNPSPTAERVTPLQQALAKGNETYQEALRLLQDPILPVRAHGLILLKELAACGTHDVSKGRLMEPALIPAILDIYIKAIQDDDSFLYLNAVKGVAEMANSGGKSMIKRLVSLYLGESGRSGIAFNKSQVDLQLRMGEALLQVVQRLEEALTAHVGEIVYPLLTALRDDRRPTVLRSSYLSTLGTCVEACPSAFSASRLSAVVIDAMLDLLIVEMASKTSAPLREEEMQNPEKIDTKLPHLRRAAILLLALFIRGSRHQLEVGQERRHDDMLQQEGLTSLRLPNGSIIGGGVERKASHGLSDASLLFAHDKLKRTESILGYIAQMDSDALARHQSQELLEELRQWTIARFTV